MIPHPQVLYTTEYAAQNIGTHRNVRIYYLRNVGKRGHRKNGKERHGHMLEQSYVQDRLGSFKQNLRRIMFSLALQIMSSIIMTSNDYHYSGIQRSIERCYISTQLQNSTFLVLKMIESTSYGNINCSTHKLYLRSGIVNFPCCSGTVQVYCIYQAE